MREQRGGRPTIDFEPVVLLIVTQRSARFHPCLAVDLVVIKAAGAENFLHAVKIARRQLRDLAPRRLKRPGVDHEIAEMTDEEHVEVGKIVFLDDEIVFGGEECGPVKAGRLQE